jgi:hypothetical protein
MARTPEATIRAVTEAYLGGDVAVFTEQLDDEFHGHGSEQGEYWTSRDEALQRTLAGEVSRVPKNPPSGELVELAKRAQCVNEIGEVAWFSCSGTLHLDGVDHEQASWSTVLRRRDGDWKIVLSHFSIHRVNSRETSR